MLRICFGLILLLTINLCFGQHPYTYVLNHEAGLPSNETYILKQDDYGFIWIGSDPGLVRYNGVQFDEITIDSGKQYSISNVQITGKNTVWCQDFAGHFYRKRNTDRQLRTVFNASHLVSQIPDYIAINDTIAFFQTDSVIYQYASGKITHFYSARELKLQSNQFSSIKRIGKEYIVTVGFQGELRIINIATRKVISRQIHDAKKARFQLFENEGKPLLLVEHLINGQQVYSLYSISSSTQAELFHHKSFNNSRVIHVSSAENRLFVGTTNGGFIYNSTNFSTPINHLYAQSKVSSFLVDREGDLLVSTLQHGIQLIPSIRIQHFTKSNSSLKDANLSAVAKNKDQLFIGNYSGDVYTFTPNTGQLELHPQSGNNAHSAVQAIKFYKNQLFVARGSFEILTANSTHQLPVEMNNTRSFCFMEDTLFFIGSDRFGKAWNQNGQWKFKLLRKKSGRTALTLGNRVYLQFSDGLYYYENGQLQELLFQGESFDGNGITVHDEQLYCSTNSGIYCYNGSTWSVPSQYMQLKIQDIQRFQFIENHLITVERNAVHVINLTTNKRRSFNQFDGILANEITSMAYVDSTIYFATNEGLISLPVNLPAINTVAPQLFIQEIKSRFNTFTHSGPIQLDYNDADLEIHLNSASIRSRGKFFFEYRLKGINENWVRIPAFQNILTFNALPAGHFELEVRALNEDGIYGSIVRQSIQISAPFWQRWWFFILILIIGFGIGYSIFRYRIREIKRKEALKQQMISAKLTALKAQMNPHFLFNTLNSLQDLILQQDFEKTNYYLGKFARLIRMILMTSDKDSITLEEEERLLTNYLELEQLRFGSDFSFCIHIDSSIDKDLCKVPSLLLQPFVENAIKHGLMHKKGNKELIISFTREEDLIRCKISDNGIGRQRSMAINARNRKDHSSFSTNATEERIDLMREQQKKIHQILIEDILNGNEVAGTRVTLSFPY